MSQKIIKIDQERCIGCGLCASACAQNAIEMVDGKAQVVRANACDGIGNCLPVCPVGAISFVDGQPAPGGGCPGLQSKTMKTQVATGVEMPSQLAQWPVQIKLVPVMAPYFQGADLLIAADCTAFACGSFHRDFMAGKVTIIGCPKLDEGNYTEKLTEIFVKNSIASIAVARMEVPCCGGLERAVRLALEKSGKDIPLKVTVISLNGTY